ncbi:hypothetical protein BTN82_14700 [Pseudomonas chlororaphis]|uniref:Fimbrial-type adhesion domain-containing protein n=1 Tax=Pseudomonas chlororaphis TaxID=587753 RepID=A0A1Q8ER67_9PSED|nr:hypothetical protein BTN82_14700 [Pseudomonas chlororaphis]
MILDTCKVQNKDMLVTLPSIDVSSIKNNKVQPVSFGIGLNCTPGMSVSITLTDAAMPTNTSSVLSLAPGSTASGVGLTVFNSSGAVKFGPDSVSPSNINQWLIGQSSGLSRIPLTVQYVSTGVPKPGLINGLMSFTLSYK